jgi:hypothetical protein
MAKACFFMRAARGALVKGAVMSSQVPHDQKKARAPVQRIAVPHTQTRTRRQAPPLAIGWLRLLPKSAFPITSHDDFAAKISTLLLGHAPPDQAAKSGHGLPASGRPQKT